MSLDPEYRDVDSRQPINTNRLRRALNRDQVPEVWLCIGQSNMAGQPGVSVVVHAGKDGQYPDFEILDQAGNIMPAYHPHHRPNTESGTENSLVNDIDHGGSMASEFCRLRAGHGGAKRVIMCGGAVGGTSMVGNTSGSFEGRWYGPNTANQPQTAGGDLYLDAFDRMQTLIQNENVWFRGILWHQGENDATALALGIPQVSKAAYKEGFLNMVNGFKSLPADYYGGHSDLIVLIGQLAEEHRDSGITVGGALAASVANVGQINEAHEELAEENLGFELVSSDGIPLTAEGSTLLHYGSNAIWEFGRRMFHASLSAQLNLSRSVTLSGGSGGGGITQTTIADFSSGSTYASGDLIAEEDRLWRANGIVAAGAFDPADWTSLNPSMKYRGTFPMTTAFPSGDVSKGDTYYVLAGFNTVVDGQAFNSGDILIAEVDRPSTTTLAGNWSRIPNGQINSAAFRIDPTGGTRDTDIFTEVKQELAGVPQLNGLALQAATAVLGDLDLTGADNLLMKMFNVTGYDDFGSLATPPFSAQGTGFIGFRGQEQVTGSQPATLDSVQLALRYRPREVFTLTGDGSTNSFSVTGFYVPILAFSDDGGPGMRVFVDGVEQVPNTQWNLSGAAEPYTLTFPQGAPANGATIELIYGWKTITGDTNDGYTGGAGTFRSSPSECRLLSQIGGVNYGLDVDVTLRTPSTKPDQTLVRGRDTTVIESRRTGTGATGIARGTYDRDGTFKVGVSSSTGTPTDKFEVSEDGIEVFGNGDGIYLTSANGTRWLLRISNAGGTQVIQQ